MFTNSKYFKVVKIVYTGIQWQLSVGRYTRVVLHMLNICEKAREQRNQVKTRSKFKFISIFLKTDIEEPIKNKRRELIYLRFNLKSNL